MIERDCAVTLASMLATVTTFDTTCCSTVTKEG